MSWRKKGMNGLHGSVSLLVPFVLVVKFGVLDPGLFYLLIRGMCCSYSLCEES